MRFLTITTLLSVAYGLSDTTLRTSTLQSSDASITSAPVSSTSQAGPRYSYSCGTTNGEKYCIMNPYTIIASDGSTQVIAR